MPIYEYRCQSCGHELEKLQRMSDAPLTDCPECGKASLKRLVSAAGFRLKGAGWYETDFKKSNQRNLVDSGQESPKSSASTDSGSAGKSSDAGSKSTGKAAQSASSSSSNTPSSKSGGTPAAGS